MENSDLGNISQQDIEDAMRTLVTDGFRIIDDEYTGRNYMVFSDFVDSNSDLYPSFDLADEDDMDAACRITAEIYEANEDDLTDLWNRYN